MSNDKAVVKSGAWYTISNFLVRGIGFITTPIFTRILTKEEFGAFNNFTSWINILAIILTLNVEATLVSARYEHEDHLDEYILSMFSLSAVSTLSWWVVANIFVEHTTALLDMNTVYMNAMFIFIMTQAAINLYQMREKFFYRYKMSVLISVLLSVGSSLLAVVLALNLEDRLSGRVYGMVLPNLIIGFALIVYFALRGKKIELKYWKPALKIVLPYIPHLLSLTFLSMIDRVMITKMCGEADTALYSLGYTVATIIAILLTSLNGAIAPWIGENLAKKQYEVIRKNTVPYILLFVYCAIGLMFVSPEFLLILGGEAYAEAKWIMIPIAYSCICQFLYNLFATVEQFEKKTVGMALASVSAAVFNFVLNLIFIPMYGYVAAAYTTLIGYAWLLGIHMYLVYRLKMSKVYNYRLVYLTLLVVAGVSVIMNFLYTLTWVRYIIIAMYVLVPVVIAIKNKEKIISFIKR